MIPLMSGVVRALICCSSSAAGRDERLAARINCLADQSDAVVELSFE